MRRTWIEIELDLQDVETAESSSMRRTWIEMLKLSYIKHVITVVLHAEDVD